MKYKNQDIAFHFLMVIFINYLNKFVHIIIALRIYFDVLRVEFLVYHTEKKTIMSYNFNNKGTTDLLNNVASYDITSCFIRK